MNAFLSLKRMEGIHFHDLEKNVTQERVDSYKERYLRHLQSVFHAGDTIDTLPSAQPVIFLNQPADQL